QIRLPTATRGWSPSRRTPTTSRHAVWSAAGPISRQEVTGHDRRDPRDFGPDCRLTERIEENKYNTYASAEWRNKKKHMFVGLSANGKPMKGRKTRRKNTATHFLPIVVQPR
ncbi:hypothetical protein CRUP_034724, partial [Coryphaenoides rupestris]